MEGLTCIYANKLILGELNMGRPAIFLDRDGTLNVDKGYVFRYEDWEWIPGVLEALREFHKKGFLLVVISNQSGIARKFFTERNLESLYNNINEELIKNGVHIEAFYTCPHHSEYGEKIQCSCRTPLPGLLFQAQKDLDIDLSKSI